MQQLLRLYEGWVSVKRKKELWLAKFFFIQLTTCIIEWLVRIAKARQGTNGLVMCLHAMQVCVFFQ